MGVDSEVLYATKTGKQRAIVFDKMRSGESKVLIATYSLAKEGLDIPILDSLHLATPQKDKAIVKQSVGRIERRIDGKESAIVYDYVDCNIGYLDKIANKRRNIIRKRSKKDVKRSFKVQD